MSVDGLKACQEKMRRADVSDAAIAVFSHYYGELEKGETGLVREDSIEPMTDPPQLADIEVSDNEAHEALSRCVVIKLNGGLGTSMGMDRAKSLLPVRDGKSFLDIVVQQVMATRAKHGVTLPLIFMNSFNTQDDTLKALSRYPDLAVDGLPVDFLQSREPKVTVDGMMPVEWPADPTLEWCPPGHGDLYPSLLASGILQRLVGAGYRYAGVSNCDNLGADPDPHLAGWFAKSGATYGAEVCRRTAMDRKGGHLAVRKDDGRLILRDTAQTADEEMDFFTDEHRHQFFHCNNLWFDLPKLLETLKERRAVLGLPLIRNVKTVDPKDKSTPEVYQIETAMGAAIEVFEGSVAICVPRSRFLPVKSTNELALVRSDAYDLGSDGRLTLVRADAPVVSLDPKHYAKIGDFESRFPSGVPSLKEARSFTVKGDWTFAEGVVVTGEGVLDGDGGHAPSTIGS